MNNITKPLITSQYEIIENESVTDQNLKDLSVAGALFSFTTFKNTVFNTCTFFGSKLENCLFLNCHFINCSFQFSTIAYCNFKGSLFIENQWNYTTLKKSSFTECDLDSQTLRHVGSTKEIYHLPNNFIQNNLEDDFRLSA